MPLLKQECRFKLTVEYDGTEFVGWQSQPSGRSVQTVLKKILEDIFETKVKLEGSGRTDSGVHALGQVASVSALTRMTDEELFRAVNSLLPADVRLASVQEIPADFDPRRDACGRWYRYYIRRSPTVFERRYSLSYSNPIVKENLIAAAKQFLGRHDFSGFCSAEHQGSTVKTLWALDLNFHNSGWEIDALAPSFLNKMVRMIVGTLLAVGSDADGSKKTEDIFTSADKQSTGPTAPPQGLFLMKVFYPPEEPLKLYGRLRSSVGDNLPPKFNL
jgi:tRNA pseudouridine38-40 synthase